VELAGANLMAARCVEGGDAVRGATNDQVVILGAGHDTHPWRFEVEHRTHSATSASVLASCDQRHASVLWPRRGQPCCRFRFDGQVPVERAGERR
jgi:Leucine carboxyl methyltransferase